MEVTNFKSVVELLDTFKDEQSCIEHLEWLRWDGNVVSPFDPTSVVYKCKNNRYRCKNTGRYFNVKTNTLFHNPNFKVVEFDHFKKDAGLPTFTMSVSNWVEKTNSIGIISKQGKYGGTYAHKDIAFEFGSAISPIFKSLIDT